jgi:valyl-tRNA synthetase
MMSGMKLDKAYSPVEFEDDIYTLWEKSGIFKPSKAAPSYSIVMPPPNANADLHIGYELTAALEDIVARYHRLRGESVLLLPGADHAGFETQSVYEKQLAKEGKSRFEFSREALYQQIWDFVALNKGNFSTQLRKMGVSCDWDHFTFTLDDKIIKRAYATFRKMWEEGLIYRGERLVNFCTFHGTAFADIEVVYRETTGHLWYIRYPLVDGSGEVVVATTRPETMLGDTAVAVNPTDKRYSQLIGKTAKLPLTNREVPIIADGYVDKNFGTGAVKITPAHDVNDFEVGKRHDLPFISVISSEGTMIDVPEKYRGLRVLEARQKVVEALKDQGFLVKTENHKHNVGHCYKCDTVIQPLLREQWFVDMEPLAKRAIRALEEGQVKFYPEAKKQQLITYLEGLHDWNISRQIAWGIPIPAFQNVDEPGEWIYDERVDQEIVTIGGKTYRRDADVFDTWFSSSSWPYVTLDYPSGVNFKKFYPLSLMETGGEILYPWVSRMLMLGLYVTDQVPFKEVYIHGYVMAEDGTKMSKSIGNVVDPMPLIKKYGSDALRLGVISGRAPAINRGYDHRRVEEARNFCNKLWNVSRYIEGVVGEDAAGDAAQPASLADHWIVSRLSIVQASVGEYLDSYRFSEAYELLYHFIWDDLADWYIEASKVELNNPLLKYVLEHSLLLVHPFAPFVTETIWQQLAWQEGSVLSAKTISPVIDFDKSKAKLFTVLQSIISEARFILKSLGVSGVKLDHSQAPLIENNAELIKRLARLGSIRQVQEGRGVKLVSVKLDVWLDIDHSVAKKYLSELTEQQAKQTAVIDQLKQRLSNKAYLQKAPKNLVSQTRQQLSDAESQLKALTDQEKRFQS